MSEFKLIVAGSRGFSDYPELCRVLDAGIAGALAQHTVSIVCGMARGADRMGMYYAQSRGLVVHEFPADWDALGKRAGYVRNEQMADFADGLLVFWDGASPGTKHMIESMRLRGKPTKVVRF